MSDVALGIDVGTSGVRIAAVDQANQLMAMSSASYATPSRDPKLWWDTVAKALEGLDLSAVNVKAIAVDGTSGTIIPIGEDGAPLGPASMYNDVASAADAAVVMRVAPAKTAARGATSPLARALSMKTRILHQADWIAGQFSGRFDVTDENNALKSGYDPVARAWPEWIGQTGFDTVFFPNVVAAGQHTGRILPAVARHFGLPADVAIIAGTTDGCAAFLASGARDPGDGVTSLGTTLTLKLLSDRPVFAPRYGIYSHRIGDQWLAGGASNTGGAVLGKFFSGDDIARLTLLLEPDRPTGLDYYPLLQPGERFPINDPEFAPRLEPRPADERVFFQAILEGIAAVEALGYKRLAELGATPLASIRSAGGGAGNAAWTRIRLNRLGVGARNSRSEHAATGTARLAWRGLGHEN